MGHRATFRKPIKEVKVPEEPPTVELEGRKVIEEMMRTGTLDERKVGQMNRNAPIVGYSGFLKGVKSENQYGQTHEQLVRNTLKN